MRARLTASIAGALLVFAAVVPAQESGAVTGPPPPPEAPPIVYAPLSTADVEMLADTLVMMVPYVASAASAADASTTEAQRTCLQQQAAPAAYLAWQRGRVLAYAMQQPPAVVSADRDLLERGAARLVGKATRLSAHVSFGAYASRLAGETNQREIDALNTLFLAADRAPLRALVGLPEGIPRKSDDMFAAFGKLVTSVSLQYDAHSRRACGLPTGQ